MTIAEACSKGCRDGALEPAMYRLPKKSGMVSASHCDAKRRSGPPIQRHDTQLNSTNKMAIVNHATPYS